MSIITSVVSRESVRVALTLDALNDFYVKMADIETAYLMAPITVNTSGKAGAQIPHLPLGDDPPPWGKIMQYVWKLKRFTRLCVTSHSQPLNNAK
jgi:hypothetical protein